MTTLMTVGTDLPQVRKHAVSFLFSLEFLMKNDVLPRQARDRRMKTTQNGRFVSHSTRSSPQLSPRRRLLTPRCGSDWKRRVFPLQFPDVCPEPVLAKRSISHHTLSKHAVSRRPLSCTTGWATSTCGRPCSYPQPQPRLPLAHPTSPCRLTRRSYGSSSQWR